MLLAVAIEEAVTHPHDALPVGGSLALGGGVVLFVGSAAAALRQSGYSLSGRRLVILAVVAAGVWATHGAAVTWSLLVVALGLLLLAAVERPTPELAVDWLSVFRWHLPARITQESVQEDSLIHLSSLVGLCVPYICGGLFRYYCTSGE